MRKLIVAVISFMILFHIGEVEMVLIAEESDNKTLVYFQTYLYDNLKKGKDMARLVIENFTSFNFKKMVFIEEKGLDIEKSKPSKR